MAIRDNMRKRCQPLLEPDEQIQQVWQCQTGGSPWMLALSSFAAFFFKYRIVCVTDRAVVVFKCSKWSATPKEVLARLPRNMLFGEMKGLWGQTSATGEKIYIHRRFHKDVEAADAAVAGIGYGHPGTGQPAQAAGGNPAGWYADANQPGNERWYDGTSWTEHLRPTGSA
jgi:hypothetical protein